MPNVYIVNRGGHDFSPAAKFGHLIYLSEGIFDRYAVAKIYREFAMKLRSASPDDYIVPTGLSTMNIIACSSFAYMYGSLNLLLFKNGRYIERRIMLSELLSKGGDVQKQIEEMEVR